MKRKRSKKVEITENVALFDDRPFMEKHNIKPAKVAALFLFIFSIFSFSALFGLAGNLGGIYFTLITDLFGLYAYFTPLLSLFITYIILAKKMSLFKSLRLWLFVVLIVDIYITIGFFQIAGKLGNSLTLGLQNSIGSIPTVFGILLTSLFSLFRIFETSIGDLFGLDLGSRNEDEKVTVLPEADEELDLPQEEEKGPGFLSKLFFWRGDKAEAIEVNHLDDFPKPVEDEYEEVEVEPEPEVEDYRSAMYKAVSVDMEKPEREKVMVKKLVKKEVAPETSENKKENEERLRQLNEKYKRPPLSMYTEDTGKASAGDNKENARIIKRTLADFGISVEMDEVTVGPTVTRYALKPAQGVKIEKIMNLANNIALELGVPTVSIIRVHERSLIGVEVPNKQKAKLGLSSLLSNREFLERKDKLTLTLGKDIYGEPVFADMTKMPHLLIAGTTGSGKSVLVHGIIHSLIYKNSPYDLKFIMVDPKKVELSLYNNLPHLYTPVIKDPKKAVQTLNWLVQEMDRRYAILEECGKQNIGAYHAYAMEKYKKAEGREVKDKLPERMPYIVLVIDELADFMMKYPKEMESGIVKLAQMSRAIGIHLILATQRPSTNIITGVIKGNIPSRIALRVASQVDSRVILDQGGAEKLLGYGDLLFVNADGSDIKRIQSPNVSEEETKDVVAFLRSEYDDLVTEELKTPDGNIVGAQNLGGGYGGNSGPVSDADFNGDDDKYEQAKEVVQQTGKTSISNLQVRLGTGYARSAKLINMLEQAGVIITVTDNNGKKVKVVAGAETGDAAKSEKLEKQADKILAGEKVDLEEIDEMPKKSEKEVNGFFRF